MDECSIQRAERRCFIEGSASTGRHTCSAGGRRLRPLALGRPPHRWQNCVALRPLAVPPETDFQHYLETNDALAADHPPLLGGVDLTPPTTLQWST